MLIILWIFQVVSLERFYKGIKTSSIKKAAYTIVKNIDHEELDQLLERLASQNDMEVKIVDATGQVLYEATGAPGERIQIIPRNDLYAYYHKALEGGGEALSFINEEDIRPFIHEDRAFIGKMPPYGKKVMESLIYTQMVTMNNGVQVMLFLTTRLTPVQATVDTLRVQLIYITLILLVVAILIAFFISKKISKPIMKITHTAGELGKGNYNIVFEGTGYREIRELNDTLNYAARELSKVETLRRELVANVSHDLRTPLTMIIGYGEMIRDLPGEDTPDNVQVIIDEASRLSMLVTDLLELSKLQDGEMTLSFKRFNLTQSIKEILERYTKLIEQQGYELNFLYEEEVYIEADELKISQVLYNLINNAINYTGVDKKVTIRQLATQDQVKVEIIDTGEGIDKEQQPYVWERYYKIGKTHKRAQIGTGLGLSIVKNILEQHHALYGVVSEKGKGSNFWFELNRRSKER